MGVSVECGRGAWIWTSDGDKYLDLYGGHAVCATGHSNPAVVKAIKEQADAKKHFDEYVRDAAGSSSVDELAKLHDLKEKGAISAEEYESMKAKLVS